MQKYVQYMFFLFFIACIAACSGSGTATTAATPIYDLPTVFATLPDASMGGAVQGGIPLTPVNTVSTLAGTAGSAGLINDTGSVARFNHPTDITTDGTYFYVADYGNNAIRQVTTAGAVTTLACTDVVTGVAIGFNRPSSITTDGINLYVVDTGSNTIRIIEITTSKVTTIGSTTGLTGSVDSTVPADVRFNQPIGITTDGVHLYVSDSGNSTIRRINITTKAVSTLAGTSGSIGSTTDVSQGAARFNQPGRITTDGINLYLTDFGNRTIRKIEIATGAVTTIAGTPGKLGLDEGTADGIGITARFNQPNGITTDGTFLYVTDSYQNTIRRIDKSAPYNVTTISGISGTAGIGGAVNSPGTPSFYNPVGITTDGTSLLVADSYNNIIRKIQ